LIIYIGKKGLFADVEEKQKDMSFALGAM